MEEENQPTLHDTSHALYDTGSQSYICSECGTVRKVAQSEAISRIVCGCGSVLQP